MSLHAQATYEVPEETARIARAVFSKGYASVQLKAAHQRADGPHATAVQLGLGSR